MHSAFALDVSYRKGSWIVEIEPHILSFLVNSSEKNCAIVPSPLKKKQTDLQMVVKNVTPSWIVRQLFE